MLAARVIVGVFVVIVVPTFPNGAEGHNRVLGRIRQGIVWVISVHVRCRVHKPREVKDDAISECPCNEKSSPEILRPEVASDLCRHYEAAVEGPPRVEPFLERHDRVGLRSRREGRKRKRKRG